MKDKVVEFREKLDQLLKGKLNDENNSFPNDMHIVSSIEDLIKDNKIAVLEMISEPENLEPQVKQESKQQFSKEELENIKKSAKKLKGDQTTLNEEWIDIIFRLCK